MEASLIESREIAPGVRHFAFEALGVARLEFVPGQFTSFTDMIGGKEITRAYSLASAPSGTLSKKSPALKEARSAKPACANRSAAPIAQ